MGLDQTAYALSSTDDKNGRRLAGWRKDWPLHEAVCQVKGTDPNHWICEVEVTQIDLDRINGRIAGGFLSRDPAQTARFLREAQEAISQGKKVYYYANQ